MSEPNPWRSVKLSNPWLELSLLPGIGGRVMNAHYLGENLLFENPDSHGFCPDLSDVSTVPTRATHLPFPLWGGEKTWVAPERDWPQGAPHPVLDSGPYELDEVSPFCVCMTSEVCPLSGLQIGRTVTLAKGDASWDVLHEMTNHSGTAVYCGIWSVMMVRRPAAIRCRVPGGSDYAVLMGDPGAALVRRSDWAEVTCDQAAEFKIGLQPSSALAEVQFPTASGAIVLTTETSPLSRPDAYAHGHALEVYNSGTYPYAELEWHAPASVLEPGATISLSISHRITGPETWTNA